MAIKDVLVCLDASETGEGRLRLAAGIARKHKAHLAAAYLMSEFATTDVAVYGPGAIGIGIAEAPIVHVGEGSGARSNPDQGPETPQHVLLAETIESRFRETLQLDRIVGDWHLFAPGEVGELIELATATDLVIVGQHQPEAPASAEFRPRPWENASCDVNDATCFPAVTVETRVG